MTILTIIVSILILLSICNWKKIENFSMVDFKEFSNMSSGEKKTYVKHNLNDIKKNVGNKIQDIVCNDPKLSKYCKKVVKPDRDFDFKLERSEINTSLIY